MALPLVAIVAGDTALAPDARAMLVSSCVGVIGEAGCVTGDDPLAPAARYLAVVTVFADGKLRVELQSRADDRARGSRDLAFLAPALGLEHWNSVGLVVAALVADAEQAVPAPTVAPQPEPRERRAATTKTDPLRVRVGVAVAAAPGFDFDPWRVGPSLSFAFGAEAGFFYPVFTTRWLGSRGRVRSDVTGVAFGAGGRLIRHRDVLELSLEAAGVAETILVSVDTQGQTERTFRFRYGARLGLASSLKLASPLHAFAGVDLTWLGRRGVVELGGQRLGTELRYFPSFEGGIRLIF